MFKNVFMWILTNVFKIQTETTAKETDKNLKYAKIYENIDEMNFNAIFSNKLANYTISDSTINITGDNKRTDLLNKTGHSLWKKAKKITSMAFGYGGVVIVPYIKGGKIFYSLLPQDRVTIDETQGDNIVGATTLFEIKTISNGNRTDTFLRWTNYKVENNTITITQKYTNKDGEQIETPTFWREITEAISISNVEKVLFGYIKSPVNNRKPNSKYGVPITYGCEATINEIKETLKQMQQEYELKENFVGVDVTMFDKNNKLPKNGLFKTFNSDDTNMFEIYDPQFRDYTNRLQELYKRLEHEVGTSAGIISESKTQNATATEIKKSMYDTFTICDDMRTNIENGLKDFFDACNILANVFNLSPNGEYELSFDWSYSLLEDSQSEWNQLTWANNKGIIQDVEIRQWLKPNETIEESKKAIEEIKENEPSLENLLGTRGE